MTLLRAIARAFAGITNFLRRHSRIAEAVLSARRETWRHTISWLGFNVLGSFMPIWGSFFLLKLYGQPFNWNDFVKHGEFALYTASFLAPALQVVIRNIRDARYVLGSGSVLLALFGLLCSAIIYASIATSIAAKLSSTIQIDEPFLFQVSFILFPVSFTFAVVVTLIENQMSTPNVSAIEKDQREELRERIEHKIETTDVGQ